MRRAIERWLAALAMVAAGGCTMAQPGREAAFAQSVIELSDAVSELRQENAMLQAQVDSIGRIVARQDTVVRQLMSMASMPMPQPMP